MAKNQRSEENAGCCEVMMEEKQKKDIIRILERIKESPDEEEKIFLLALELAKEYESDDKGFREFLINDKEVKENSEGISKLARYIVGSEKWVEFRRKSRGEK